MSKSNKEHKPQNYRLTITDDHTHEKLWTIHFTKSSMIITICSFFIALFLIIYTIIAFTPLRSFIPGYPDAHSQRIATQNAIKIDSLETSIYKWELYIENLMKVIDGADPTKIDSLVSTSIRTKISEEQISNIEAKDSLLREIVEKEDKAEIKNNSDTTANL